MKTFIKYSLLAGAGLLGAALLGGCADTPGYSGDERGQQIGRNWAMQWEEASDDVDNMLLLRPDTLLTGWDIRHRE